MNAESSEIHHSSFSDHRYPKRLIEVDLPIKRISAHALREKDMRRGHVPMLHIWWACRPPAACRAVLCAGLWPDPADALCPESFRETARKSMRTWAEKYRNLLGPHSMPHFIALDKEPATLNDNLVLRQALLDFIADFANWDNSTKKEFLDTSRALTQAAHEALGGAPGTRPFVVDPFAGGGAIPIEALRIGADAFASDLNPVAVLLNKVVLEYIPKYGQRLADEVRRWGEWLKKEAEGELAEFYPKDLDGATPIAYLWARTIRCEGPGCGAEVPLMRGLWLAKRGGSSTALRLLPRPRAKRVDFEIVENANARDVGQGTIGRGSASCPVCGYTTPVAAVRRQLKARRGGSADAMLVCVVTTRPGHQGRFYRLPTERDLEGVRHATAALERRKKLESGRLSLVPDEPISLNEIRRISVPLYGMATWGDLFTPRQALALSTFCRVLRVRKSGKTDLDVAAVSVWALCLDKMADMNNSLCGWQPHAEIPAHLFTRQAIPMVWDFAEANPLAASSGSPESALKRTLDVMPAIFSIPSERATVQALNATANPLPDDSAHAFVTDPPYYDAVPYAHLSDFFYVWLRRTLGGIHPDLFSDPQVPKDGEIVVDRPHELSTSTKDIAFYESELTKAFGEGRRILRPDGIGTIVFASKTTASWEAVLQAVVNAGWVVTGSWPIDTEMQTRVAAQGQARLASSIHLVCRPRENTDGSVRHREIGDWRDVLQELPGRIHEWMPRLAEEGVVGADAIFACLGPALEIFSRYSRVEKASGEAVTLKEYLEHVWAAVAKEALSMIFAGADATGFEEDARLTAMWLWTLSTGGANGNGGDDEEDSVEDADEDGTKARSKPTGFVLEYDAARKIAQGLGAHLEALTSLVEVKGDTARLLPVAERTKPLFGKDEASAPSAKRKKKDAQLKLGFEQELEQAEEAGGWGQKDAQRRGAPRQGETVLDRIHQAMILFAAGRSEALRRFLVDDGAGRDERFWRLAQALSALYPSSTDEKRWVDGVLARKKGLGF
jgi:putative DNA methylase